jgi:multidrug efflux pump subunit AcrB
MNVAEISIKYRLVTLVFTALVCVGGILSFRSMGRLEDPEFTIKDAQVITQYPGASAWEVSQEVSEEIETAIQQMGQLKRVTSTSTEGLSIVQPTMKDNYDRSTLPQVWDELRRKVGDAQSKLPTGVKASIVNDDFGDVYGVFFALYGDGYSYKELKDVADTLRRELLLVEDVGKVAFYGDQKEAVYVEIPRAKLAQLGLSPDLIVNTINSQNQVATAGKVRVDSQYVRIQPSGAFQSVEDVGDLLILQPDGTPTKIRIRDVARIRRGYVDPPTTVLRYDGHPAIGIGISTVLGGNVVRMGTAVKERMMQLMADVPVGIEIGVIADQGGETTKSINNFLVGLAESVVIVIGVLMFAMGLRSGLLMGGVLLITVLGTFIFMKANGVLLERISLGALVVALGMLVDNAIVITEGILVGARGGITREQAASGIVKQTMWPLFGATVIAVLAFAAIGVSQDSTGEFCRSLFQVILYSLMLSWVIAITVTPLLGSMFLRPAAPNADGGEADPYDNSFFRNYRRFLQWSIRRRWLVVALTFAALAAAVFSFKYVTQSFFPPSTRPQFLVHYWLPQGVQIERTVADVAQIEEFALKQDGVSGVASCVGQGALRFILTYGPENPNTGYGLLLVSVDDYRDIDGLMEKVNGFVKDHLPDAQCFSRRFILGPGEAQKIQVRFRGPDPDVLRRIAAEARELMLDDPMLADVVDDWRQRTPLIRPVINETVARNAGVTRADVGEALQRVFGGLPVGQYREGKDKIPIFLAAPEVERLDAADLDNVMVWSPVAGRSLPLAQFVSGFQTVSENAIVKRRDRLPTITVKGDPRIGEATPVLAGLMPKMEALFQELSQKWRLGGDYTMEWGGEYESSRNAQTALAGKLPLTFLLMVLICVVLFNSLKKPLVIFLTVPLAMIGVTLGLLVTGQPFGFMALLGLLSLIGMQIKNAIVLVDEIGAQLAAGVPAFDAVVNSGVSRLRPVSMGAITTVLGMIPLLIDPFFASMAVTIMFGLTGAALFTLVIVPVFYAIVFKVPNAKAP